MVFNLLPTFPITFTLTVTKLPKLQLSGCGCGITSQVLFADFVGIASRLLLDFKTENNNEQVDR